MSGRNLILKQVFMVLLILSLSPQAHSQPASTDCAYPGAPLRILEYAKATAEQIFANPDAPDSTELGRFFNIVVVYTAADAITDIRNLKVAPLLAQTARTDKQIGASARSGGTTSIVEKPGFVDLLGFAIEHGAVQQKVDDTSLTLSTSPYALLVLAKGKDSDTAEFYRQNEFFNRFGISANFSLSDNNDTLANANSKQLHEWSIRVRLFGDRSLRSKEFQDKWDQDVRPLTQRRVLSISSAEDQTFEAEAFNKFRRDLRQTMIADLDNYQKTLSGTREEKVEKVRKWIICTLKTRVFDVIVSGEQGRPAAFRLDDATRERIKTKVVMSLKESEDALQSLKYAIDKTINEFNKRPFLSFAYANHYVKMDSDYQVFKLLFEQDIWSPMKIVVNIDASIYNNPDPMKNQDRWRDIAAAISFEGKANSPFNAGDADLSKITYSFSGRYQRLRENKGIPGKQADLAVVQGKFEIPLKFGVSIPFSITYANATEFIKEKEVRGNVGITFDVDKLFALTR